MRFLSVYRTSENSQPPTPGHMAEMQKLIDEMTSAGVLLATEGCMPSVNGARIRLDQGKVTVTDGPFAESKELIAGFALLQTRSREEAVEWARRFLAVAGDGETELRQIWDFTCNPELSLAGEAAARS
jgi:hypothetical protein